jgi:hypothetical protein
MRGRGLPSLGLMARLGVPVGGRVRKLRAVEDQSAPIPKEITSKLGGSVCIGRCAQLGSSHPPFKVIGRCGLADELFEHPAGPTRELPLTEMVKFAAYVSGEPMARYAYRNWQIHLFCGSAQTLLDTFEFVLRRLKCLQPTHHT